MTYLPRVARDTVDSCSPVSRAMSFLFSGRRALALLKHLDETARGPDLLLDGFDLLRINIGPRHSRDLSLLYDTLQA